MRKNPAIFRKGMHISETWSEIEDKKRLEEIARRKAKDKEIRGMNKKIDELIKAGKSSGAIKQTIKKLYPEISKEMESTILILDDETKIDRLTLQLQDRVEKFRNSLPVNECEEKSKKGRTSSDDGR